MDKIIIVESPTKTHSIKSFLGDGYTVLSSMGHVSDLSTKGKGGLGIDIENGFTADYVVMPEKAKLVNELKKACKGHQVFLASDPDREGEAIAWHLAKLLGLSFDDNNRIEFHEITKTAVLEALKNPHKINQDMVSSQETRRIIDRILGFKLSKLLQKKIGSKSAGRVQSVVLLLICNLEKEIRAFIPTAYYEMEAIFDGFKLKLNKIKDFSITSKNRITDRSILEDLAPRLNEFVVSDIVTKKVTRQPQPTFTTSTLQQDASSKLGFSPTRTMSVAQSLYEGVKVGHEEVGLITYMRTDSTRLADSFVKEATGFINSKYGNNYLGSVHKKNQKGMQDAHEGIRPTSIARQPEIIKEYLTSDQYKLYNLIYKRTLASLMSNAIFNQTNVIFENTDSLWNVSGSQIIFDGYLKVYKDDNDEDSILPLFKTGDKYTAKSINILDKQTEPKKRYTEASIIKDMETLGIGRPSTYAQTIKTLKDRDYIKLDKKSIVPTEQGMLTSDKLQDYFEKIINVGYTAEMETDLDEIAQAKEKKNNVLNRFYSDFMSQYDEAASNMDSKYPIETDEICPICGNKLVIRLGKYGEFVSCSNYPDCKYIKKEELEDTDTGILCPTCNKYNLFSKVAKSGKNKGNTYYACKDYPKCKTIFNDKPTHDICPNCGAMMLLDKDMKEYCSKHCNDVIDVKCPSCKTGHFVKHTALRGRNRGNVFYSCSNFPKCKVLYNDCPTNEVCDRCGAIMLRNKDGELYCSKRCDDPTANYVQEEMDLGPIETVVTCPSCKKGRLIERIAKSGKNKGNKFYGCSNFPKCKNIISLEEYNKIVLELGLDAPIDDNEEE